MNASEAWKDNPWQDADGINQPVADGVRVDVVFADGSGPYTNEQADYWDWEATGYDAIRISKWRYSESEQEWREYSAAMASKETVKDTNPKDSIGIRKAPMSTVPMNVVAEVGVAMLEGAAKYGRHNYRTMGVRGSVYFDATMRHLVDWWEGVDIDPDSGMSHITKAITSLMVLRDAQMQGMCTDDRPPRSEPFYGPLNDAAGKIVDKYADKSPRHYTIADSNA